MSGVIRRAWVDMHIGWHEGAATRAETRAKAARWSEQQWRAEYDRRWPSAFAPVDRLEVPQWVCDAFDLDVRPDPSEVAERNLRVVQHEIDTPMRGHDDDGACCRAARDGESK